MAAKILFLDSVHPILEQRLVAAGMECVHDYDSSYNRICEKIKDHSGLVIRSRIPCDKNLLDHATALKFIARAGSGLENIDLAYARQRGIEVFNSPEGNRDAVGEHALGMLLMLMNNLRKADHEVRNKVWQREANRGTEISGKTIGIIGYGMMGASFAEKLSGLKCRIIAFDKYKKGFATEKVEEVSLKNIFEESDIVSIHVPLTDETRYLVNESFLASFSKPIILINTSRGPVVNTAALINALSNKKITGACLDVLEYEETSFERINLNNSDFAYLASQNNVVLTPHIAGWTHESYFKLSDVLADKILDWIGRR